ncbi:MAG: DUF5104 domain-containing protein [Clostridiales bacterium]|nr:DUF5104 domain-containing protein [Clostridiales bacterium]
MGSKNLVTSIFLAIILLYSCAHLGGRVIIFDDSDSKADVRMGQIKSAVSRKDSNALKSLFSKKSLDESDDIENCINELFRLVQGEIQSCERGGFASSESIRGGKSSETVRFAFTLTTDIGSYLFFVVDYVKDTIEPENEGVYMLELIEYTDEKNLESWQNRLRAGVYILK